MDFTGGVSSLVQGRLNGVPPSANGSMMAMAYAPDSGNAGPFVKAPRRLPAGAMPTPITVWANSFGGQRTQDETDGDLACHQHRLEQRARHRPAGYGRTGCSAPSSAAARDVLSVDLGSQRVDTDYLFAGGYSRFEWAAQFLDFTGAGRQLDRRVGPRLVLNNGAAETGESAWRYRRLVHQSGTRLWHALSDRQWLCADADGARALCRGPSSMVTPRQARRRD